MKKILLLLILLVSVGANAQYFENGWISVPKTTAQITGQSSPVTGKFDLNSDTNSLWFWDGTQWVDTGVAASGDNLGNHTATQNITIGDFGINFTPSNNVTRWNWFNGTNANTFNGGWASGSMDYWGFTGSGGNISTAGLFGLDYTDDRWEIANSPIVTQSNAASLGIGGGDNLGNHTLTQDLLPDVTNTRTMGAAANRFFNIYTHTINASTAADINVANITELYPEYFFLGQYASDPAFTIAGSMYYNTTSNGVRVYNGTSYVTIGGSGDVTAAANFGTDNALVRSDGTNKGVQSGIATQDDSGNITATSFVVSGSNDQQLLRGDGSTISSSTFSPTTHNHDYDNLVNVPANSILGNNTGSLATAIAMTKSQVKTFLSYVESNLTGEPNGAEAFGNMVKISQSEYDGGTPVAGTDYFITDSPASEGLSGGATDIDFVINEEATPYMHLDNTTDDVTAFTLTDMKAGYVVEIYLNQATEPSFTPVVTIKTDTLDWTADSLASTDVTLTVKRNGRGTYEGVYTKGN